MNNLETAIFYTCATCNLNCRYCGIDKNPALKLIDDALGESFEEENYYFERVKKYFDDRNKLKTIEIWGGEPLYKIERLFPTLHKIINYYPKFNHMYFSTNFSYPSWTNKLFSLFDQFGQYPDRKFNVLLQISSDGPDYINDSGRGNGVGQKCRDNFDKLIILLKENRLPQNVEVNIAIKPTLDLGTIQLLQNKEKIIDYYQFFEYNYIDKIIKLGNPKVTINFPIPNTAVPSPVTTENGKEFANLCRLCKEIEKENAEKQYFLYYKEIVPMRPSVLQCSLTYRYGYHTCGIAHTSIGFLPNNRICTCHGGFTTMVEEYKKFALIGKYKNKTINFNEFLNGNTTSYCLTDEQYLEFKRKMDFYNSPGANGRLGVIVTEILALAGAGQIDPRFKDQENALKGAIHLQSSSSYCVKDNLNENGSFSLLPLGIIKQLLNGANDFTWLEGELPLDENISGRK